MCRNKIDRIGFMNKYVLFFLLISVFVNAQSERSMDQDFDGDGIVDSIDECPKLGGFVNEYGCPRPKEVMPISAEYVIGCPPPSAKAVYFKSRKVRLRKRFKNTLDEIVIILKEKKNNNFQIYIQGNTDSLEASFNNLELSKKRVKKVMKYLVSKGIDESRLVEVVNGDKYPIANNATRDGRAQNRRVDFKLIEL